MCFSHGFCWWLQHQLQKLLRDKDRLSISCAPTPLPKDFKSETLDSRQGCCLLQGANQDRGFAKPSCCVLLPALGPPPRRCLSTVVSQWDPYVLDERPGELNHPWSGVFYQALLQPSIIWIPQKGCEKLISPQGFQWLLQVLPSPIPATASCLTVLVLVSL